MSGARRGQVHISGIGGTAMVAGAQLAIEAGWKVRGSDGVLYPPVSEMVAALGVPVTEGYAAQNLDWQPDIVLLGNVLSRGNPEVEAALSRRLRYMSLPEWLKEHVLRARRPVVIAGTHGKTTTTAMTAHVLNACGLDPGYLIGGMPKGFKRSARLGPVGAPFVIEGDEYDTAFFDKRAKFLHYLPEIAVVTSIEFDHGDIYRDLEEIETAFARLLRPIAREGWLVACADTHAASLISHAPCQTLSYGFTDQAQWRGAIEGEGADREMVVYLEGIEQFRCRPAMAGRHNWLNALAALAVGHLLGAAPAQLAAAVESFPGVRRRMDCFHEAQGILFIDDFAHHPTAIGETLAAAREHWPGRRILALFEPRSNTTVTRRFEKELGNALAHADWVGLGPIHRGDTIPDTERLQREAVQAALQQRQVPCVLGDDAAALCRAVQAEAKAGDVVLVMSNGAFGGIYNLLQESFPA